MWSDRLEKGMMLAHGDGRRRRGRPRRKWMDKIHEVTGMKLAELRDVTTERKQWRRLVKTVARAQKVDSTRWQDDQNHFLPIMPMLCMADYWNNRYQLRSRLFRNLFSQNVRFRNANLLVQCKYFLLLALAMIEMAGGCTWWMPKTTKELFQISLLPLKIVCFAYCAILFWTHPLHLLWSESRWNFIVSTLLLYSSQNVDLCQLFLGYLIRSIIILFNTMHNK